MKLIKFPTPLSQLSFEELISRSNKLITDGNVDEIVYKLYTNEFKRRINEELTTLQNSIETLKNETN